MDALEDEDDERFRVDFVWGPVFGSDLSEGALDDHMPVGEDGRVRVWYDSEVALHSLLAQFADEPAPLIDHYFVFEPRTTWEDDPGEPIFVQDGHGTAFDEDEFIEVLLEEAPVCDEVISE